MPITSDPSVVVVRSFRHDDQGACLSLYVHGLLGGKIADNDTGLDVEDIDRAYMRNPANHFWIAEVPYSNLLVGMIGVQQHDAGAAEIRRLRVHPD